MNRCELAHHWHKQGYNCAQAVVAAFEDVIPLSTHQVMDVSSGFGGGAGTGELCGAISGGIMALGLTHSVDHNDPVGSKQRTVALSQMFQARFQERLGHLRCAELLDNPMEGWENHPMSQAMGFEKPCHLIVTLATEIVEEMLKEEGIL